VFASWMVNTWEAGTLVAIVAGVVGFFTVLRGSAFAAHAIPKSAFAGVAGASLVGASAIGGLAAFAVGGALLISVLGRKAGRDVATALAIVVMLGLGDLFITRTSEYAPVLYGDLFGDILGVSRGEMGPIVLIGALSILVVLFIYRPLMVSSVLPEVAESGGISGARLDAIFLVAVALVTAMAVPVVGALLIFSLLISPAAAASCFTSRPLFAMLLSVLIALGTVWTAIALSFLWDLPVGFIVGSLGAVVYSAGRLWSGRASLLRQ